ncbi:hypothetical protein CYMTET_8178 [Cymbomonas tetramitiformis]|uniref:Uncharacterized protein n=1 Tax=Cymbomonas tetramitiformis TaxID=36881 RepID=A0AAE0GTJ7_9CHLO|nr:hypothetical protein CYMTET_8178 [Cymbomonas tetramitiformis]
MDEKAASILDHLNQSNEQDEEELTMPPTGHLSTLLDLRSIGTDKFLGTTYTGWKLPRTFGGLTFSQALVAACRTVEHPSRVLHSIHSYFISAGSSKDPITYIVKRTRDTKTFSNRKVHAVQGGRLILEVMASFQVHREDAVRKLERQNVPSPWSSDLDRCPPPESCPSLKDRPGGFYMDIPGEWRIVEINAEVPSAKAWIKAEEAPSLGNGYVAHFAASAFFSDILLLPTSFMPFASIEKVSRKNQVQATLCHTMWFHKTFRADDWLLLQMESPIAMGERALCHGKIFNSKGELVVSMAQEGMLRYVDEPAEAMKMVGRQFGHPIYSGETQPYKIRTMNSKI